MITDKVHLNNLAFFAYHGALPEESSLGQKFFLDLELSMDLRASGQSDNLEDTVCYNTVFQVVQNIVKNHRFKLIEALAETIAQELLKKFSQVQAVHLIVKKPEAPIEGIFDYVGVEIYRTR